LVAGSVDGCAPGNFLVDTGNDTSLLLHSSFVKKYGFVQRYPSGTQAMAAGVGGMMKLELVSLKSFRVGAVVEPKADAALIVGGVDPGVSDMVGGIGIGFLSHFVLTFDYPGERIFLARVYDETANATTRLGIGLAQDASSGEITIENVADEAPAQAAGLVAGNRLLAVDGTPVKDLSLHDVLDLLKARPGRDAVTLRVQGTDGGITEVRASYFTPKN